MSQIPDGESRRDFLKQTALAALAVSTPSWLSAGGEPAPAAAKLPWYRRTLRWGQTNITEIDPTRYDIGWWRKQWKRTHTQGVIINAGGIVAYYPSRVPLHRQAQRQYCSAWNVFWRDGLHAGRRGPAAVRPPCRRAKDFQRITWVPFPLSGLLAPWPEKNQRRHP